MWYTAFTMNKNIVVKGRNEEELIKEVNLLSQEGWVLVNWLFDLGLPGYKYRAVMTHATGSDVPQTFMAGQRPPSVTAMHKKLDEILPTESSLKCACGKEYDKPVALSAHKRFSKDPACK